MAKTVEIVSTIKPGALDVSILCVTNIFVTAVLSHFLSASKCQNLLAALLTVLLSWKM